MSESRIPPVASPPQPAATRATPAPGDSLLANFVGRPVRVRLINGEELGGTLGTVGKYELILRTADGPVVVFKGALATITTPPATRIA